MKYCASCHVSYPPDLAVCPVDNSNLRTTSELLQGMIIRGKYEILEKIGSGGMASVYRARHLHFDEIRAIKVVRSWMAEDASFVRRLRSEAMISRKLQHPNAVRVDDLDSLEDGRPFIVMEYVEGPDLRNVIKSLGPMPLHRVINIGSQVAAALGAAHQLHIIHRDIKPDNIRLVERPDGSEFVKVLDFGIAKLQGAAAQSGAGALTMTGMVVCTPDYASPEQARGANSSTLDGRSDLYSLGIVMYEMLTGELPFHSDTPIGMLLAQIGTTPRSPSDIRPELGVPEEMSAVLMKCLEKEPANRFQTADDLVNAMAAIDPSAAVRRPATTARVFTMPQRTAPTALPPTNGEETAPSTDELTAELRAAEERRRRTMRVAIALAAVVAIALAVFLLRGSWASHVVPRAPAAAQTRAPAQPGQRMDADVLADVKLALAKVSGADKITASVSAGGEIHLAGQVPSEDVIERAALHAARVRGVASVDRSAVQIVASPPPGPVQAKASPQPQMTAQPQSSNAMPLAAEESPTAQVSPPQKHPEKPEVEQLLAQARQQREQGQFDKALASCAEALRLDRGSSAARKELQLTQAAKKWFETNNQ